MGGETRDALSFYFHLHFILEKQFPMASQMSSSQTGTPTPVVDAKSHSATHPSTHHLPLREALIAATHQTPPFSLRGKCKLAKVVDVLREDTLTAIMPCDGVLTQFLIKLKGIGCWPDVAEMRGQKIKSMQQLATLTVNKICSIKCYFHTLNNELVCSLRLEDGSDIGLYMLERGLAPPFSQTSDMVYRPLVSHPPPMHSTQLPAASTHLPGRPPATQPHYPHQPRGPLPPRA